MRPNEELSLLVMKALADARGRNPGVAETLVDKLIGALNGNGSAYEVIDEYWDHFDGGSSMRAPAGADMIEMLLEAKS